MALEETLQRLDRNRTELSDLGRCAAEGIREYYSTKEMTNRALDVYNQLIVQHT